MDFPLIGALHARNYRSIGDVRLELDPITALVGRNAAGKSNLVDIPRFIADALSRDLDQAISSRGGIESLRRWSPRRPRNIEVGLTMLQPLKVEYSFTLAAKQGGTYVVSKEVGRFQTRTSNSLVEYLVENGELISPKNLVRDIGDYIETELSLPSLRRLISRDRKAIDFYRAVTVFLQNMQRLHFYNISPSVMGEIQKPTLPYPLAENGQNSASSLRHLKKSHPSQFDDLTTALGTLVPGIIELDARQTGGYLVTRIRHRDADSNGEPSWLTSDQESVGTLRLLGILLAIHQQPAPRFIALEEPEMNVHPGAASKLADYLQAATSETQILLTTHSPDLIDPLPPETIRAIQYRAGSTTAGPVSNRQLTAMRKQLFTLGELHQQEGLEPEPVDV